MWVIAAVLEAVTSKVPYLWVIDSCSCGGSYAYPRPPRGSLNSLGMEDLTRNFHCMDLDSWYLFGQNTPAESDFVAF